MGTAAAVRSNFCGVYNGLEIDLLGMTIERYQRTILLRPPRFGFPACSGDSFWVKCGSGESRVTAPVCSIQERLRGAHAVDGVSGKNSADKQQ